MRHAHCPKWWKHKSKIFYTEKPGLFRAFSFMINLYFIYLMKRIIYLVVALLVCNNMYADNVTVRGKINNAIVDSIQLAYNTNTIAYYPQTQTARLDKDGTFSFSITVPEGTYTTATIKYVNSTADLLLQPGDNLVMTANGLKFDSTQHYEGTGSNIQNFIARHYNEMEPMNGFVVKAKPLMTDDSLEFIKGMNEELEKEKTFVESDKSLPASFVKYWETFFQYTVYYHMLQYPLVHEMMKEKRYDIAKIPEGNYAVVNKVPYAFNDSFINIPSYLLYVSSVFYGKLQAGGYIFQVNDTSGTRKVEDSVNKLANKLLPDKTASYFFAQDLYAKARRQEIKKTEGEMALLKKRWPKSTYLPTVEKQVAIARQQAPGMMAPDFAFITEDGKKMKLSDLRGKVVYLNFWANTCRECVGEMIGEKKMKDLMKDKPVVFVYVSIDNAENIDTVILRRYEINGIATHVGGSWHAKVAEDYGVQALPAYYLIDKKGRFAVQTAPTPQQETDLILAIGKLLE